MTHSPSPVLETAPQVSLSKNEEGYRVSARRYRPKTFSELLGQETLVQTLSNGIKQNRLPHAFIFTGIRGVGKTTTARLLARSLNCVGPDGQGTETITPCGACEHCRAIDEDRHMDVIEMDAASRTGVDDVREVIEMARYKPVSARYKVYIIDEVHMLSKSAFNALLKTLEEPPPHVKFIFATTEIRKVPKTVLSRCMRFDLRRLELDTLIDLFKKVCDTEKIQWDPQALAVIAKAADGSARDGLSILDQAMTTTSGHITLKAVQQMLGVMDKFHLLILFQDLQEGKIQKVLNTFTDLYKQGADPLSILKEILDITHWLTVLKVSPEMAEDPSLSDEEKAQGLSLAKNLSIPVLTRQWQILLRGIEETQYSPSSLQAARMVMVRLAYVSDLPHPQEIARFLEKNSGGVVKKNPPPVSNLKPAEQPTISSSPTPPSSPQTHRPLAAPKQEETPPALAPKASLPQTFAEMIELFQTHDEPLLYSQLLHDVRLVSYEPGKLSLNVSSQAPKDLVLRLTNCLKQWTGEAWIVTISQEKGQASMIEQQRFREEKQKEMVAQDPLVKGALETFPGATITAIKERTS